MNQVKHKILIVDDEKEFCSLLVEFFEGVGYAADVAYNGEEGIKKTRSFEPDVVLLDVRMAKMDGFEALIRIKECCKKPVIMLSAIADLAVVQKCLEEGAHSYITKPIDMEALKAKIEEVLGK